MAEEKTVDDLMDIVDQIAAAGSDDSNGQGDGRPKTPISILEVSVTKKKA